MILLHSIKRNVINLGLSSNLKKFMKRKVVQIVRCPIGGIRKHIFAIVDGLSEDYEMHLILDSSKADKSYFEYIAQDKSNKIQIHELKIPENPCFKDILNILSVLRVVRRISPSIIHGHGAKGGLYARLVGALLRIKVIYTAHGGSVHDMHGSFKNKLYSLVEKSLFYFTDILMFESKYTLNQYSKKIGKDSEKFVLNYNSIDFKNTSKAKDIDSREEIIVGAFGSLRFIKGHDLLVEAVSNLNLKGYKASLRIFGTGEEEFNLISQAKNLNIGDRVSIMKDIESVDEEMKKCHIIAHPSRFESFGYVPLEATSNGVCVVSTLSGGLNEVMDSGKSGFCTNSLEVSSIEKCIEMAILNEEERNQKFSHALDYMRLTFSNESFLKKLDLAYGCN